MKFTYLLGLIFISFSCQEEDDHAFTEVPSLVASTFQLQFPEAKELEWQLKNNLYEVEFEVSKIEYKALFNQKGKLIKYKYDENFKSLPKNLQKILLENFDLKDIDDIETIREGKEIYYQFEIEQTFTEIEKIFDKNGKLKINQPYWD